MLKVWELYPTLQIDLGFDVESWVELGIWVEPDGLARIGLIFWRVGP